MGWNLEQSYLQLPKIFYENTSPTRVEKPQIKALNKDLATFLGLEAETLQSSQGEAIFGGNEIPPGAMPISQAYAGHQFGYFTKLGDGRAILLGEQTTPTGEKFDVQLKGAGRTPF